MRRILIVSYFKIPNFTIREFSVVEGISNNLAAPFEPDIFQAVKSRALIMLSFSISLREATSF